MPKFTLLKSSPPYLAHQSLVLITPNIPTHITKNKKNHNPFKSFTTWTNHYDRPIKNWLGLVGTLSKLFVVPMPNNVNQKE